MNKKKHEANECPKCKTELPSDFEAEDIVIDPDLGFVTLATTCPRCHKTFELFYDYDRTEEMRASGTGA